MYKVISNEIEVERFITLNEAMAYAKSMGTFVTIRGPDLEVVGRFGVDAVVNGLCPDGVAYDWNKASRIGQTKRDRV